MKKKLIFDMDGTIANLYGYENWLSLIETEDPEPYRECSPLVDMDLLGIICHAFKGIGFHVGICTWGSKSGGKKFLEKVSKEKMAWLKKYDMPFDSFNCVPYGTPKHKIEKAKNSNIFLVDDNLEVTAAWEENGGTAIVADENLIENLIKLLNNNI